ncbi:MAG: hypothetical protein GKR91_07555 [Pseudomonadales bacterium]|nr:hypothetical protein [Pseudomonadales bacterium]
MALKRRHIKEDLLWLKWNIVLLVIVLGASLGLFFSASVYRDDMQNQEFNALSELDFVNGQIRDIENAEQVIINNIDTYNTMIANAVLEEEDRVSLLEEISVIRDRYQLFPIAVEIQEQDRVLLEYPFDVENPDEQISLRNSQVSVQIPLLHEEDLTRFLADFMSSGRMMVNNSCAIAQAPQLEEIPNQLSQRQIASCGFHWYTLRREPFIGF